MKAKSKIARYKNLIKKVVNWKYYLWNKFVGFNYDFNFKIRGFEEITVPKNMLGPFRENFLDDIYFRHIPIEVFKKKKNPIIIDVGANVGFFSLAVFSKFPNANVYAFEPHPYCFNVLDSYKQKFYKYNWNIYNKAVSNQNGSINIKTNNINGFTTVASVFLNKTEGEIFSVEATRFDSFIEDNKISCIDFIKLDCEGSEYSIIYSLPKEIFKKINSLCIETHKGETEGQNLNSLHDYLKERGYMTKVLDEGNYSGYIWAWKKEFN